MNRKNDGLKTGQIAGFLVLLGAILARGTSAQVLDYRFRPPTQVNQVGGPHYFHMNYSSGGRAVAAYGDAVYVAYSSHISGNWDVMIAATRNGGLSFGPNRVVNDTMQGEPRDQLSPDIAVDFTGKIYVAWQDNRVSPSGIYLAKSLDGGLSFGSNQKVSPGAGGGQYTPALATGPKGQVYVAWSEYLPTASRLFFGRSRDGGNHFQSHPIDTSSGVDQHYPTLAVGLEGDIYVAWTEAALRPSQVYFARSTDRGKTFLPKIRVSGDSPGNQFAPSLSVSPEGEVYVAWTDMGAGSSRIRIAKSLNRGESFGPTKYLGDDEARAADQPSVSVTASDSGRVAVAWQDNRYGPGNVAIAFSQDGGSTFRSDDLLGGGQKTKGTQSFPSLAFGTGKQLNVSWTEYQVAGGEVRDDIFFSQGSQPQPATPPTPTTPLTTDSLYQNYPNPMISGTTIGYDLLGEKEPCFLSLIIYDLTYQKIKTLVSEQESPGSYRVVWDGQPDNGINVTSGVYYYQLVVTHPSSGGKPYVSTKRLVVSR